ncbi:MAG: cadherin domain-containing protein [Candidatus Magnetomorum sp.]|nr:cadherin domain-containing protein [Candidatus Magnetomorum sp.]
MKKSTAIIALILLICSVIIYVFYNGYGGYFTKDAIVIAAVTMSGERTDDGISMINGIKLCLDEINKTGGIDGRPVVLKIFDDFGNPLDAMNIASRIVNDGEIQIVLGHFFSSCCMSVGRIYASHGIPAITGSATGTKITLNNKWFFRTIPDNEFQGSFIAYYIKKTLKKDSISIVYEKDDYGISLYHSLKTTAENIGLAISHVWALETGKNDSSDIVKEIWNLSQDETLVMATHSPEAVKLLSYLKYPGCKLKIFGSDSFSTNSFLNFLKSYPQEMAIPGYYSDDIIAITPFIQETGSLKTINFIKSYKKKYKIEPTWIAASYYDAALTAVEAIKLAEIKGDKIRKSRRLIRDELAGIYSRDKAVEGVSGSIFFDKNGNIVKPLGVGYYTKGNFLPSYSQYQPISDMDESKDSFNKALKGDLIPVRNIIMKQTDLVYTGIKLNKISAIDFYENKYELDFLIWFRFKGNFDESEIVFKDAVKPIQFEKTILEEQEGDTTLRVYHIKAEFKKRFMFNAFPFDIHKLNVRFHHRTTPKHSLIFIADKLEYNKQDSTYKLIKSLHWEIIQSHYFQDIHRVEASASKFIDYSQFNTDWYIKRKGNEIIIKTILPIILYFMIAYFIIFLPHNRYGLRLVLNMFVFFIALFHHFKVASAFSLTYFTIIDYLYFVLYIYVTLSICFSILFSLKKSSRMILFWEKIFVPVLICFLVIIILYFDSDIFINKQTNKIIKQQKSNKQEEQINKWIFSVPENSENDTFVGTIRIKTLNNNSSYKYDILSGNSRQTFLINQEKGEIRVANKKQLDHELQDSYHLTIKITDSANISQIGTIVIYVKDINEPPVFYAEDISINEDLPLLSTVTPRLNAMDPDNDPITYTITSGNEDHIFDIEPETGEITTFQILDYETVSSYTLECMIFDTGGLSAYQKIHIKINDVNEPPTIEDQTFYLTENMNTCTVGEIIAHDPENSPLNFKIISPENLMSAFYIDDRTLKIFDSLNLILNNYTLTVEVSDSAGLKSTAKINIQLRPSDESTKITDIKKKILFLNPSTPDNYFWKKAEMVMRAACEDLNMDIKVYYARENRAIMISQLEQALEKDAPDAIVFKSLRQNGTQVIDIANKAKITCFMFYSGLTLTQREKYGKPREKYPYWIGEMIPDNTQAGYDLSTILIETALKNGFETPVRMIGIAGIKSDQSSISREKGLMQSINERKDIHFLRLLTGEWEREKAKLGMLAMYERFPVATVVWAANDPMAMGVIDACEQLNLKPGKDVFIGGMDWTLEAFLAVKQGKMTATIGGHFMDAGWVMILLHDFFKGNDFAKEGTEMKSRLSAITQDNVNLFLDKLRSQRMGKIDFRKIDFSKFSKVLNPEVKTYEFGLGGLLKQFESHKEKRK